MWPKHSFGGQDTSIWIRMYANFMHLIITSKYYVIARLEFSSILIFISNFIQKNQAFTDCRKTFAPKKHELKI